MAACWERPIAACRLSWTGWPAGLSDVVGPAPLTGVAGRASWSRFLGGVKRGSEKRSLKSCIWEGVGA